jgi:hypothetical protein
MRVIILPRRELSAARMFVEHTSIKILDHQTVHRLDTRLVKVTDGNDHDNKGELWCRVEANLGSCSEQKGTEIHGTAFTVGWHELEVIGDRSFTGLDKEIFRYRLHAGHLGRVTHTVRIDIGTEDPDLTILAPVSLDTLEALSTRQE